MNEDKIPESKFDDAGWQSFDLENNDPIPSPSNDGGASIAIGSAVVGAVLGGILNGMSGGTHRVCLLYTSPSPRDLSTSRMPSSA